MSQDFEDDLTTTVQLRPRLTPEDEVRDLRRWTLGILGELEQDAAEAVRDGS